MDHHSVDQMNLLLCFFSIAIALATSYTVMDILLRRRKTNREVKPLTLWSSATAMGLGAWSMHFVGMFACIPLGETIYYDYTRVLGSLGIGISISYLALYVLLHKAARFSLFLASFLMSLGIGLMHFVGLEALFHRTVISQDVIDMTLAGVIVFVGSYFAFESLLYYQSNVNIFWLKIRISLIMGIAIVLGHYTAMSGLVHLSPVSEATLTSTTNAVMLRASVGIGTFVIVLVLLLTSFFDRKMEKQSKRLKRSERYYQSLFEQNPDLILTFDLNGHFLSANQVVEEYGYTIEELLHRSVTDYVTPDQLDKTVEHFRLAAKGQTTNYETAFHAKQGDRIELNVTNIPIIVDDEITGVYGIIKDITSYKRAQEALVEAESKYRSLVEESLVGIYIIQEGRFVYVNQQLAQMIGYTCEEIMGSSVFQHIHPQDLHLVVENIEKQWRDGFTGVHHQYRAIRKDQSVIYVEVLGSTTIFNGKPAITGSVIDITEQKRAEQRIQHLAYHDALTGLPNRVQFTARFQAAVANPHNNHAAILFLDLDRFKLINDTLGHDLGDQLLKEAAERLKHSMGSLDSLSRHGGDEFILFLHNVDQEGAAKRAQHILDQLNAPFHLNGYEMYLAPSIGISLYPQDGEEIGTLIQKADVALQQAKQIGRNHFRFYINESLEITHERFELERDLRKAIERDEFILNYQPKLNIQSGEIIGLEALLRWQHPEKGLISPARFIPLAEESGLIIPIGEWALRKACADNKALQNKGFSPIVMSVNLSMRQFYQPNLIGMISEVLHDTELSPEYLELEMTESIMIDTRHALMMVKEMKNLGVKISLDDFGTGYSSLHYLKAFPIDKLKIDQSFIRDCLNDENDATIAKTIIAMAHQLNLDVIAEGVETKDQLIFLQQNLCNEVQGYLFSRPLPMEELEEKYHEIEQLVNRLGVPRESRDQKWAEELLRVAQEELQDTVRQQQGMTFKYRLQDGKFIHTLCDGELLYRMGLVPEQVVGKDPYEVLPQELAERLVESYQRAWDGEDLLTYEDEYNGIHFIASLRPIRRGGQVVEVIVSCVDITKRKQIEEDLKCSEAKYRLIAENMSDVIGVLDANLVLQYASPSHETVLGYPPASIEGQSVAHLVHPDDWPSLRDQLLGMVSSQKPVQVEFRHKHKVGGHWVYVEAKGSLVFGEDGQVEQMIMVLRDMTERKEIEKALRKSDKLSVVAELAAGFAHEIRNPLTSIKGFVQLLKLGMSKPDYFDIMLEQFQQLEDTIHEFLLLAKPQMVEYKKINLQGIVTYALKWSQSQAISHSVQIKHEFENGLPFIWCDEHQMKQVLIHLLQNAIESMPDGGEMVVHVKQMDADRVSIHITDQGCGIPVERMNKLGEPFYSTKEKGTGLGLMVCYRMIEEHKGTIQFESEVGRGTSVEVVLPIKS